MKIDWNEFVDRQINITMKENYGVVYSLKKDDEPAFYEIVFKTGILIKVFDEGLLLEAVRDGQIYKSFIPYESIKSVDIF
ncbi:MAG: hypothetical protein KKF62_10565 [Bacteroidetes bacterium]|nr:hypothetical protein [Bacteroidota bacterium]MBU1113515.1 hypothetical protein [Bacteroidota bacterium]MBU1797035.1 hypothetical protein [Bacteroidota bacterium]